MTSARLFLKSLTAISSGALLVYAFAPYHIYILAFICPAVWLWTLANTTTKQSLLLGWLMGCGLFGNGVAWVYISAHTYGNAPVWLSGLITLAFVAVLALFPALQAFIIQYFKTSLSRRSLCIFPATWLLIEWLRSWLFTGFPWLLLGNSQINSPLHTLAPLIGVYGLSLLVALSSGALYLLIKGDAKLRLLSLGLLGLLGIASLSGPQSPVQLASQPINISILQGNIPQSIKWDPEQAIHTLRLYYQMTVNSPPRSLIVWPEAAIPITQDQIPDYLHAIKQLSQIRNSAVLTGIPVRSNNEYYNGIMVTGNGSGVYLKQHLVPFGEFYPFKWLLHGVFDYLNIPMSDLNPGPNNQAKLNIFNLKVASFICYEIAYPQLVLAAAKNANLLVTVSDDSWFGDSIAANQHLEIAQMRALETGRYLLFSTNGGISALIAPTGQLLATIDNARGSIHSQIYSAEGSTYLMQWGYLPLWLLVIVLVITGYWINLKKVIIRFKKIISRRISH